MPRIRISYLLSRTCSTPICYYMLHHTYTSIRYMVHGPMRNCHARTFRRLCSMLLFCLPAINLTPNLISARPRLNPDLTLDALMPEERVVSVQPSANLDTGSISAPSLGQPRLGRMLDRRLKKGLTLDCTSTSG